MDLIKLDGKDSTDPLRRRGMSPKEPRIPPKVSAMHAGCSVALLLVSVSSVD